MAISINWSAKIISVPKADMALIQSTPTEIRELDLNVFRLTLKDLEDSDEGMHFLHTHNHNPPVSVGGVTLARVVEIINDYTVTFEDGQYAVNLVGANSNVADRTNVNQVSVRSANSAGLVQTREIEHASFNGGVYVDAANGSGGTIYPNGTERQPVNNLTDALFIANLRGFDTFYILGDITVDSGGNYADKIFKGQSPLKSLITVDTNANVLGCEFYDASLVGVLDGNALAKECHIGNLTYVSGHIERCLLTGTIVLGNSADAHILDCWDGLPGGGVPTIDMGGSGQALNVRNYSGGLQINNKTGTDEVSVGLNGGRLILDSTVTNGNIIVRGVGKLIDNSGGTATVDSVNLLQTSTSAAAIWAEVLESTYTSKDLMRLIASILLGKVSGGGSGTEVFRDLADSKNRMTVTVDSSGNRTAVTRDPT